MFAVGAAVGWLNGWCTARLKMPPFMVTLTTMMFFSVDLLHRVGLELPPDMLVQRLSAGERQLVEMAKALNFDARLIILNEPTTSLSAPETRRLFGLLKSLRERGIAMIYVSHALGDVQELCDQIVVLRDGQVVGSGPIDQYDNDRVVSLMVGRRTDQLFPERTHRPSDEVALPVRHVSQPGIVEDVSFKLHSGEVLGLAGLMGIGRTELARILFGLDPMSAGRIEWFGRSIESLSTRQRIALGMTMLTESRRDDGLCMQASIADNISSVAAVLGGTSLFGGWGNVLPGTVLGAVLFQTVENGLVIVNADEYLYPMILSGIIFVAVLLDTSRVNFIQRLRRRNIRVTHDEATASK